MLGGAATSCRVAKTPNRSARIFSISLAHPLQARDAASGDPFGDEDITIVVEAGVVGVDEFAVDPGLGVAAVDAFLFHDALDVVAELGDDFVSLVEQRDAGMEFGDEHQVFVGVDVGGEAVAFEGLEVFAGHREVLQRVMRPVADDYAFLAAGAAINPDAVRQIEFPIALAGAAKLGNPVTFLVVAVDVPRAVAIGEQKAAVIEEGEIGGHEGITTPTFHAHLVLILLVNAAVHGGVFFPNCFAFEGQFRKGLYVLIGANVKELLFSFSANFNTVTASLKLVSKGTDKLTLLVEHKNGWMTREICTPFMDDINQTFGIHRHIVGGLPSVFIGQLRPIMLHLKLMLILANDHLLGILIGQQKIGHGDGRSGSSRSGEKTTTGNMCIHK